MSFVVLLIEALHIVASAWLALYALHEGALLLIFMHARRHPAPAASLQPKTLPAVTVQLPMYNEPEMAARIIHAACALDYPQDLLQIQVLDDSTDETCEIAQTACANAVAEGHFAQYIHRPHREGFKAGALAQGLKTATGEFIAIFDADFVPPANFLRVVFAHGGFDDPGMAFVQARWDFLNRTRSATLSAQGLMLDMHFVIEQTARSAQGLLFNFNGSAGVWRRASIDALGWQADTLAEDLDLSYRAELAGWKARYLDGLIVNSELVPHFGAFANQQARWARGSAQNVRKLAGPIVRAHIPLHKKIAGLLHISGYFLHALLCVLAVTTCGLGLMRAHIPLALNVLGVCGIFPLLTMWVAHRARGGGGMEFLRALPLAALFGIGLAPGNAAGWLTGLFGGGLGVWDPSPKGPRRPVTASRSLVVEFVEVMLGAFTLLSALWLAWAGQWLVAVSAFIYACGFCGVLLMRLGSIRRP